MGIYRRRDSPTFWMSLQVDGQRVRQNTMVEDRQLAEAIFAAWKGEVAKARWLGAPPSGDDHTVADLIAHYLKLITPRKSGHSQRRDRIILARLRMRWGHLLLQELTPLRIEEYVAERTRQVSFATVSKELGVFKAACHCAIRWGWLRQSPFLGIVLNQEGTPRVRWLSQVEEQALLAHCDPLLRDLIIVGLDTGLRPGNLVGLQCAWVQSGTISLIVPREQTKTKKRPLTIPLTTRAAVIIRQYLASARAAHLFVTRSGRPLTCGEVNRALHRAATASGLTDVCLYTLRHTFISRLVQAGVSLPEVAALAGHQDIRMTMRYAHLAPQHLQRSIAALEANVIIGNETGHVNQI
jgi:integrase